MGLRALKPTETPQQKAAEPRPLVAVYDNSPPQPHQEATKDDWGKFFDHLFSDLKITDVFISIFTAALAIYTYRLCRSTDRLWATATAQLKEAANATSAMNASNEIVQKAYVAEHRPWLTVNEPKFESRLIFQSNTLAAQSNILTATVSVLIINIGKSPAYDVSTFMQPHEVFPGDSQKRYETRQEAFRRQSAIGKNSDKDSIAE